MSFNGNVVAWFGKIGSYLGSSVCSISSVSVNYNIVTSIEM